MQIRLTARGLCLATRPGRAYHAHWFADAHAAKSRSNNTWLLLALFFNRVFGHARPAVLSSERLAQEMAYGSSARGPGYFEIAAEAGRSALRPSL